MIPTELEGEANFSTQLVAICGSYHGGGTCGMDSASRGLEA